MNIEERFKTIKAFAFDVDGVMTDGGVFATTDGELYRTFDAKDSFAMRMASMKGFRLGVITGGKSRSIVARMKVVGVNEEDVYLGSRDKMADFKDFLERHDLKAEDVMYFGDDVPDMPVMKACGCGVAPSDAMEEVIEIADYVSPYPGGKRCVRHTLETVMRLQGKWELDLNAYERYF